MGGITVSAETRKGSRQPLPLFLLVLMALALSGCGGQEVPEAQETAPDTSVAEGQPEDTPPEPEAPGEYQGETMRIAVGYSAGGGFDLYARTIARHLGRHIPGEPDVVVENMPGAGGVVMANALYRTLPQDGTYIGAVIGNVFLLDVLGTGNTEFEGQNFQLIGAPHSQRTVCLVHESAGVSSIDELGERDSALIMGGTAPGNTLVDVPRLLAGVANQPVEVVTGYDGTAEIRLAMEQGEVDGGCWGWESMVATMAEELEAGVFIPLVQSGYSPHPDLLDVPLFQELVDSGPDRDLLEVGIDVPAETLRTFMVGPDVPEERVRILREAFAATFEDPEFLAEAETQELEIDPRDGEELQRLVGRFYELDDDTVARLAEILGG
jgi:tripartite-type tricarboxylate transporter receptor subunit TctC